jgi:hypothetical protein
MKDNKDTKQKNDEMNWKEGQMTPKKFLFQRYILLAALVCAVLSVLMDQGVIHVEPKVTNAFTIAAFVGVVLHLLRQSFASKAAKYRATLERLHEMEAEEATEADEVDLPDEEEDPEEPEE